MSFKMSYDEEKIEENNKVNGEALLKEFEEFKAASRAKTTVIVVIAVLITFCATILAYGSYLKKNKMLINTEPAAPTIEEYLARLNTVMTDYYKGDRPEDEKLIEGALKGYVDAYGDPYTTYLTADEWKELDESLSDFVGIGVYLSEKRTSSETVILGTTSDESPAAKAGIKAGDIIIEVDLEDVSGKGSKYVSEKVRGLEGTTVKLKVLRGQETLEFNIERQRIKAYEIKHEMLDGNIGYIDFDSFTEDSYKEFKAAIDDIMTHNPKGLIIDLRDNTGGYVDSALNIADLFVDKGKTLLIQENNEGYRSMKSANSPVQVSVPIVVLVNGYTASASEILTGILRDYDLATIVGTQTYGKGVIQTVLTKKELKFGEGALKVTTEEYYTPNGDAINKKGIKPDVEIELDEEADSTDKSTDNQLQKALEILKNN